MSGVRYTPYQNLPREFYLCGNCGKRGVYQFRPQALADGRVYTGLRCKYCKAEKYLEGGMWLGVEKEAELLGTPLGFVR